ncbi:sigma-E factor negative regulatory protein [Rhodanobacter sp. L36]|uniref:sigma-E factor negative regulatory protein n=1 Tax=Rhodanobacter sp. L36 TaxID=1747221 RepID=UPI00131D5A68|nr:sigma-E factor negative regulatory protein [Rhodanobacter sp. L36]
MNKAGMNQDMRENLSAGIDGELSKEELRFLLRRLDHDALLQQAWARYHTARDGLRRELPAVATPGFAERVMLAIEQEHVQSAPVAGKRNHWLRWSAGGAIAASVAAAALMISQPAGDASHNVAPAARQAQAIAAISAAPVDRSVAPAAVPQWLQRQSVVGASSQQASFGDNQNYARSLSNIPSMRRYRTLDNNDGSYLILLDPDQQVTSDRARQAAAAAAR